MRWTEDLCGAEPIIKDMAVYDAANLANGEMLMKGATLTGGDNGGVSLVTAYAATATSAGVDNVGILNESQYNVDTTPSATFTGSTGVYLGKVIINPLAVYRAEYLQTAVCDVAIESNSTTTLIKETIATADEAIGAFVYFTHTASNASAIRGCLRQILDNETTHATVAALPTTPATTDMYIVINPANQFTPGALDATATGLSSAGTTLTNAMSNATGTNYRIVQSWIEAPGIGFIPLVGYKNRDTKVTLGNMNNLPSATKFYSDIVSTDHMFCPGDA